MIWQFLGMVGRKFGKSLSIVQFLSIIWLLDSCLGMSVEHGIVWMHFCGGYSVQVVAAVLDEPALFDVLLKCSIDFYCRSI